jgi:tetratricopeptide (TPR) repeat protein
MARVAIEYTLRGFVDHFGEVHRKMSNFRFAWLLGAGASCSSGIPLGSELVDRWLKEMRDRETSEFTLLSEWATADRLQIRNFEFEKREQFYSDIYQRRFRLFPEEGYAFLESIMANREPGPGYSILAGALAAQPQRHNVVITTNFDNLAADALSIYTNTFPLIVGHESLAGFVEVSMRRPLICKIHRDVLLTPHNDRRSLRRLHDAWGTALRALFKHYTPLIIGYGGNDDTLMDLLESLEPADIKGPLVWCYYEKSQPSERIVNLVADLNGFLVAAPDFDSLMLVLGQEIGLSIPDDEIIKRATGRCRRYRYQIMQLLSKTPAANGIAATMEKSERWWKWYLLAQKGTDLTERERAYRQGIHLYKDNAPLHGKFANFMRDEVLNPKIAEELYIKAHKLDSEDGIITADFAQFVADEKRDCDQAENLFQEAVTFNPSNAAIANSFANFLWDFREDLERADRFYRIAVALDPRNANIALDSATFVWNVQGLYGVADYQYREALKLNPGMAGVSAGYAGFLLSNESFGEAMKQIERAKKLNANLPNQMSAILAFYEAIINQALEGDCSGPLKTLENLLAGEFKRYRWKFERVLRLVEKRLPDSSDLFKGLAARIEASATCS